MLSLQDLSHDIPYADAASAPPQSSTPLLPKVNRLSEVAAEIDSQIKELKELKRLSQTMDEDNQFG